MSLSLSTPVPILWRMHLHEYQCVGMVSLFLIFLSRVVAWSFIFWNDHHQWQTIAEDFKPHIHSWFQTHIFFDKQIPSTVLLEWGHLGIWNKFPGTVPGNCWTSSWEHCKKFLGTKIDLHGSKQPKGTIPRNFSWNPFFTWHKMQVSAMFPRTFPGIETASFWDLCPACQGSGGGWKLPGGPLDNQGISLDD